MFECGFISVGSRNLFGYGCDKRRGTCVRAECVPACTQDEYCAIEYDDRARCIENPGTLRLGAAARDAGSD